MTFAEFLSLVEEYNLPVEEPERLRFMIKDMSAAEFRKALDDRESEGGDGSVWTIAFEQNGTQTDNALTDGNGNRWKRRHRTRPAQD